jgi:hypothetical protein
VRRIPADVICLLTDWLEGDWLEYRSGGTWWHRRVGSAAQVAWFEAHNCRLYCWSDNARRAQPEETK